MSVNPRVGAWLLWLINALAGRGADVHRPVLYAVYGSDIIVRLMRIHADAQRDGPDGWLVVALHGRRPAYVRCQFADNDKLICEAIVGRYSPEPEKTLTVSTTIEDGLKKSGYWRDTSGRALFTYEITPDSGVWGGASVVILDPLIRVFGARATSKIDIIAPLAPERDEAAIQREMRRG